MGVEIEKRRGESAVELRQAVNMVVSLLRNLKNLNVWWFTTYSEFDEYGESRTSTMLYRFFKSDFDSVEVRVATLEPGMFRRLYYADVEEPFLSETNDLEGWVNISDITNLRHDGLAVYVFKIKDTAVLGVSDAQLSEVSRVFEYPPRSFASVVFFMINPEVDRFLRDLVRTYLKLEESLDALSTWEYVYDRVRETKVERDIAHPKKLEYGDAVGSAFAVDSSQRYRALSSVGTWAVGNGEDLRRFYTMKLRGTRFNPEYFMIRESEMAYLMRRLLPRSDVVALLDDVSSLLQMVRKIPVLVKTVESVDGEWFTKGVELFPKRM